MERLDTMDAFQVQQHQHQQQHHRHHQFASLTPGGQPGCTKRTQKLEGKDLIIRMLAEVFQVNQLNEGQVKWHQVSTSLVPVSLYSRTTSKWLNYLLAASSVAAASNTASGMSPDSRNFLLLLQQFHQQNRSSLSMGANNEQNLVIFQVVAHDFVGGQWRKIVNVKLAQPGTRLGQASDHFVYWKEHRLHQPTTFVASQASLVPFVASCRQQSGASPVLDNQSCCQIESQTWGLNFASINDAKLFYDICSLNLVDLDFNSEYLKRLALSDKSLSVCHNYGQADWSDGSLFRNLTSIQNQQQLRSQTTSKFKVQNVCQRDESSNRRNVSTSKCPLCKHLTQSSVRSQTKQGQANQTSTLKTSKSTTGGENQPPTRIRSRSTTRQAPSVSVESADSVKRTRSLSNPESPQHANQCPSSLEQSVERGAECAIGAELHHPKCAALMRSRANFQAINGNQIPPKPARGLLRESSSGTGTSEQAPPVPKHQTTMRLDHYQGERAKQGSQLVDRTPKESSVVQGDGCNWTEETSCQSLVRESAAVNPNLISARGSGEQVANEASNQQDQLAVKFASSRSSQRRSTGIETSNVEGFASISNRDARLARARYANSKNTKEFLSLDAGGIQATPTQLRVLNERFQQQQQQQKRRVGANGEQATPKQSAAHKRAPPTLRLAQQIIAYSKAQRKLEDSEGVVAGEQATSEGPSRPASAGAALRQCGAQDTGCNVATTTDDLPLDPLIKRRMFNLDARDSAMGGILRETERPINLGPEEVCQDRKETRSSASRRRSLERSMCVDLADSSTPINSAPKAYNLSPLAQSASLAGLERSKGSQSQLSERFAGEKNSHKPDASSTPDQTPSKRARTKSSGEESNFCPTSHAYDLNRGRPLATQEADEFYVCHRRLGSQTIAFKSVPDFNRLYASQCRLAEQPAGCLENYEPGGQRRHFMPAPKSSIRAADSAGLSSYAVPLRHEEHDSMDHLRQFRSCPNSLRRRRKEPHHCEQFGQGHGGGGGPNMTECCCLSCHSRLVDLEKEWPSMYHQHEACFGSRAQSGCQLSLYWRLRNDAELADKGACFSSDRHGLNVSHCYHQQQLHRLSRINNIQTRPNVFGDRLTPIETDWERSYGRHCGGIGASSHLGPYESDCENESPDGTAFGCACCEQGRQVSVRSPSSCCGGPPLNPVQGYDQTLARATLKSRQRARSQPPSCQVEETAHLTKSMENVEKLIKEVQNELNILRERPAGPTWTASAGNPRLQARGSHCTSHIVAPEDPNRVGGSSAGATGATREVSADEAHGRSGDERTLTNGLALPKGSSGRRAGLFKCVGAIRKAGFLSVKKWILKRKTTIDLARKQGWKRYWVCLRGSTLLFHSVTSKREAQSDSAANFIDLLSWIQANCGAQLQATDCLASQNRLDGLNMSQCFIEKEPRHLIIIEGSIAQPVPEHPKREFVFCLSTTFGDAYLFQSGCQLETDNWISAIHNACAASIARDLTREEAMKLFATKVRQLELEAEKKLFLRQRLESRLTSMSSISHIDMLTYQLAEDYSIKGPEKQHEDKRTTMRSLLFKLSQQLMALDSYLEQVHCEIFQLRCYLSSCGAQRIFYAAEKGAPHKRPPSDLPHPRSLLMHVSKPTKVLLIKLGVFTVSSFHAYIHARQGNSETILQTAQLSAGRRADANSPIEFRLRSQSTSAILLAPAQNAELEKDTEQLIDMSNFRLVCVQVSKDLWAKLATSGAGPVLSGDSDDRYSIKDEGGCVKINIKLHSSSSSNSVIKQVLKVINPSLTGLEFLSYYLRLKLEASERDNESEKVQHVARRNETLNDWPEFEHLELLEKVVFRVELTRDHLDEEALPFGISVGAQMHSDECDSLLTVHCNYIEWGSVADKTGLRDEDEFLVINGVPVMDLDMMFIECIIQDETKLRLVVRSSRSECPEGSVLLAGSTWQPTRDHDDDSEHHSDRRNPIKSKHKPAASLQNLVTSGSQIISDEYISTLVCPPPPGHSEAAPNQSNLVRRKSAVGVQSCRIGENEAISMENLRLVSSSTVSSFADECSRKSTKRTPDDELTAAKLTELEVETRKPTGGDGMVSELLRKTDKLSSLLGNDRIETGPTASFEPQRVVAGADSNSIERLKKSTLELLETEYAYIKHLETINQHYMGPLSEISFLNIEDLKHLSQKVVDLISFQRAFFSKLACTIKSNCNLSTDQDHKEDLDKIVHYLELLRTTEEFKPILNTLAATFLGESENFEIYSSYCSTYSRLQKLLHFKGGQNSPRTNLIASIPTALDTFVGSNSFGMSTTISNSANSSVSQHRDFLKPLGTFMANNEPRLQVKQLSDFLANLDSSSSSNSLSLPKSSASERSQCEQAKRGGSKIPPACPFQKSVHQQNFESYLIKPIQRIVKYPMLLNSIALAAQVFGGGETCNSLQAAVKQMESITGHVNDTQRIQDEYGLLFAHLERHFSSRKSSEPTKGNPLSCFGPHQPPISLGMERLLHFGLVDWLNIGEFTSKLKRGANLAHMLFVFESCVVFICKERVKPNNRKKLSTINSSTNPSNLATILNSKTVQKFGSELTELVRYQSVIPVSEVQVRSVADSGNLASKLASYQWELFRCSSVASNSSLLTKSDKRNSGGKVYLLASPTNEIRNAFLRKIRFTIRESVRSMSLPLAKSPPSKSLTYKKLDSPTSEANSNSSCSHSTSPSPACNSGEQTKDSVVCQFTNQVDNNSYKASIEVNT